jgi:hypothetical protein
VHRERPTVDRVVPPGRLLPLRALWAHRQSPYPMGSGVATFRCKTQSSCPHAASEVDRPAPQVHSCMESLFLQSLDGRAAAAWRQSRANFFAGWRLSFASSAARLIGMNKRLRNAGQKVTASELRALDDAAYRGRSDVYRYLRRNYARLVAKRLGRPDGPYWDAVAAFLSERGFENVRGEPLNGDAVPRVYRRV